MKNYHYKAFLMSQACERVAWELGEDFEGYSTWSGTWTASDILNVADEMSCVGEDKEQWDYAYYIYIDLPAKARNLVKKAYKELREKILFSPELTEKKILERLSQSEEK